MAAPTLVGLIHLLKIALTTFRAIFKASKVALLIIFHPIRIYFFPLHGPQLKFHQTSAMIHETRPNETPQYES
jgi:hypothetical protein